MKQAVYDKQFKMAAVKMSQEAEKSVSETAKELGISGAVCAAGLTSTMHMEKVRSHDTGTHFSILRMK